MENNSAEIPTINELLKLLDEVKLSDRGLLKKRLLGLNKINKQDKKHKVQADIYQAIQASIEK